MPNKLPNGYSLTYMFLTPYVSADIFKSSALCTIFPGYQSVVLHQYTARNIQCHFRKGYPS